MTAFATCPEDQLAHYTCFRTPRPPGIDGRLDDPVWEKAQKSRPFVDLVTEGPAFLETRMAALYDDTCLYIGYWVEEPDVRASLTERDSYLWTENDVELFIAGSGCYYELQVNALGTIYEVFYIWQDAYHPNGYFDRPEFDLRTHDVDILGGFQDGMRHRKHPRGKRWAFMDWDFPGLRTAVHVNGTLNDSRDIDKGWTVEMAFPWKGMALLAEGRSLPPRNGDVWRMDFSRFEALSIGGRRIEPAPGWALNKHGVYDSHIPECFSFIHFSDRPIEQAGLMS